MVRNKKSNLTFKKPRDETDCFRKPCKCFSCNCCLRQKSVDQVVIVAVIGLVLAILGRALLIWVIWYLGWLIWTLGVVLVILELLDII